ncbi:MAG: hypothetical protein AL399_02715 [Candidatus [Bacteroides] periocalifornicus]|uniref:Uncharacterized protein n=1 Tax=Candidatus [Bacteroides] periocalifornicus TaxID=1702214 RepID=A0A0Q4B1Z0_9BACT|nr:MAG: hypothetical protein AL399_02715 [Candidatus [Bacteroides] periocalifornicus]
MSYCRFCPFAFVLLWGGSCAAISYLLGWGAQQWGMALVEFGTSSTQICIITALHQILAEKGEFPAH